MSKYYRNISNISQIDRRSGSNIDIDPVFKVLASDIMSQCTFLQKTLQQIIYDSHESAIFAARKYLKDNPNPKSRVDFLCSFPYPQNDEIVAKVFEFAKESFKEIYEIRNVLAHETWSLSENFPSEVVFSSLEEESRLSLISGRLWHNEETKSLDVYHASIRFIRNLKFVSIANLDLAMKDINICNWALMHINNIINEKDIAKKEKAREAFFIYRGTAHIFPENVALKSQVVFSSKKEKSIDK